MQTIKILLLSFFTALSFGIFNVSAQQPEQIDVTALTISLNYPETDTRFVMRATNSAQTEVVYQGIGGYFHPAYNCNPCKLPNSFTTDGFLKGIEGRLGFYDNPVEPTFSVDFFVSAVQSDVMYLRPTIRRKPRSFSVTGASEIHGRVEVRNRNRNIIAVDNDVVLKGGYVSRFTNNNYLDGRKIEFREIKYSLSKATN